MACRSETCTKDGKKHGNQSAWAWRAMSFVWMQLNSGHNAKHATRTRQWHAGQKREQRMERSMAISQTQAGTDRHRQTQTQIDTDRYRQTQIDTEGH